MATAAPTVIEEAAVDRAELRTSVRRVMATGASYSAFEIARQMKGVFDTLDLNAVTGVLEELRASREVERIPVGSKFRYRKLFRREAVA